MIVILVDHESQADKECYINKLLDEINLKYLYSIAVYFQYPNQKLR